MIDSKTIRVLDLSIALFLLIVLSPLLLILFLLGWVDTKSPLFSQTRYGKNKKLITVVKFRSMKINAPNISTELIDSEYITSYGKIIRKAKLDELPQLWSVLRGDMSLVGPRPCLPSQEAVIKERERLGVFNVKPGITGLAQVLEVDMSNPKLVVALDQKMIKHLSIKNYFFILLSTLRTLIK